MITLLAFIISLGALATPVELIRIRRDIEDAALPYFINEAHPKTGLIRDRARNFSPTPATNIVSSLAATGMGLAVIAHAAREGRTDFEAAESQTLRTLRFVHTSVPHHKGWLLHFAHWETGERVWKSEFSTIDTALFLAGALYAAAIFPNPEISELTRKIFRRVDFHSALTDEGKKPRKMTLSLSYTPEEGWTTHQWETFAEQQILVILGIAHPTRPLPVATWRAWRRDLAGIHMPLFIHQYSHLFIDFRSFEKDIWQAGLNATFLNRNLNREGFWGLSAGDSPSGYLVSSPVNQKGSYCIGCAIGSAMYAPDLVMRDAHLWKSGKLGKKVWGKYGFTDSINLNENWYARDVIGITKAPEYLSIQNMEGRTSIWKVFMAIPEIQSAVRKIRD